MTFEQLSAQTSTDHPIVSIEDIPVAVTKIRKLAGRHVIDLRNRLCHRLPRFTRRQLSDSIDHLTATLRSRETEFPAERIPQKAETPIRKFRVEDRREDLEDGLLNQTFLDIGNT